MLYLSSAYTMIALTIVPALFMITLGYTKSIKAAAKQAAKATGQVSDVASEDINALTVIKVFTREEKEALRFGEYVDKNRRAGLRVGGLSAQFAPLVSLLVILGTAAVLGVGGYVANGNDFHLGFFTIAADIVDVGTLILFLTFLKLLYQPMREMIGLDREAAKRAFDGFLAGKTLTANQIQFVNLVIDYLTQSGWMRAAQLYESPFTDFSPRGVEGVFDSAQVTQLLTIIDSIRQSAAI